MARVLASGSVLTLGLTLGLALGGAALFAAPARAACPPAVALTGDAAAVRAVRVELEARGIAAETPRCPVVRARIERRGALLIVGIERPGTPGNAASVTLSGAEDLGATSGGIDAPRKASAALDSRSGAEDVGAASDRIGAPRAASVALDSRSGPEDVGTASGGTGAPGGVTPVRRGARDGRPVGPRANVVERAVGEPATAATVIESWVRSDLAAPLLETRAVPELEAEAAVAAPAPAPGGIQLFAAEETSFASDHTVWQGMQLGACVRLGPICGAARVHGGKVISGPRGWDGFTRKGAEVYAGVDVPIALGGSRLTPGFAAGYGTMLTHHVGDREGSGIEIGGLRAEVHVAFTMPLTARFALDLATTAALTQATNMETHGDAPPDASVVFPDAPRAVFRFAVGVRYGAL